MPDKAISELVEAAIISNNDLFVLEQGGTAKNLKGSTLKSYVYMDLSAVSITALPAGSAPTAIYDSATHSLELGVPEADSIEEIELTSTSGAVDAYTITLSSGATSTFTVTNGSNIQSISKTGASGLVDTYTVTLTDGSTTTFTVTNGRSVTGVSLTSGTHAPGTLDTYTVTYDDGDTSTFKVYNGADGQGSPGSGTPLMDGIATAGTATAYAREDHVHPADSSMVPASRTVNAKALSADVVLGGSDIMAAGYEKATASESIAETDTVNQALGKLEYNVAAPLPITALATSGNIALTNNSIMSAVITGAATLGFPTPAAGVQNQMMVYMTVAAAVSITWPTGTLFVGSTVPTFDAAKNYRVIIEYDPVAAAWVVGAVESGAVSA